VMKAEQLCSTSKRDRRAQLNNDEVMLL